MAKSQDQFEKFKNVALTSSISIKDAISPENNVKDSGKSDAPLPSPAKKTEVSVAREEKQKKDVQLEQVSFFVDKELKRAVGLLKYELDVQLKDLYEEAIRDLLKKYHKL